MVAIMAAGMTPPLGLALATYIAKKKFTPEEQEAGKAVCNGYLFYYGRRYSICRR